MSRCDGCFERIADHIAERARTLHPLGDPGCGRGGDLRMDEYQCLQLLRLFPERRIGCIGKFFSGYVGQDLRALHVGLGCILEAIRLRSLLERVRQPLGGQP